MDILVYTPDEFREMKERNFLKHALNNSLILYEAGPARRRKPEKMTLVGRTY